MKSIILAILTISIASTSYFSLGFNFNKVEDRLIAEDYETIYCAEDDMDGIAGISVSVSLSILGIEEDATEAILASFGEEYFYAFEFADKRTANDAYSQLEDNYDDLKSKNDLNYCTYGKKGNVVYFGTVDAVKDALGRPASLFVREK